MANGDGPRRRCDLGPDRRWRRSDDVGVLATTRPRTSGRREAAGRALQRADEVQRREPGIQDEGDLLRVSRVHVVLLVRQPSELYGKAGPCAGLCMDLAPPPAGRAHSASSLVRGEPVLHPVLLAALVHGDRRRSRALRGGERRRRCSCTSRCSTRRSRRPGPGRRARGQRVDPSGRDVDGAGKVGVGVERGAERLDEDRALAAGHAVVQVLAGDAGGQRGLLVAIGVLHRVNRTAAVTALARRRRPPATRRRQYPRVAVEFAVLGPLEVRAGPGVVPVRRGLPRTLLVALLLRPGHTVSSDFLIDAAVGRRPAPQPRQRAADPGLLPAQDVRRRRAGAAPSLLETRAGGYALVVEPDQIDASRFEAAVRRFAPLDAAGSDGGVAPRPGGGRRGAGAVAGRGARGRGRDGLRPGRDRSARRAALGGDGAPDRPAPAPRAPRVTPSATSPSWSQRLPLRERFHEQLVLALYRSGRQADALRAYEEARRPWSTSSGVDPGADLRDLEQRGAAARSVARLEPPPPSGRRRGHRGARPSRPPLPRGIAGRVPVPLSPLIGRDDRAGPARRSSSIATARVTLTGPAGAGKTRWPSTSPPRSRRPVLLRRLQPDRRPGAGRADRRRPPRA